MIYFKINRVTTLFIVFILHKNTYATLPTPAAYQTYCLNQVHEYFPDGGTLWDLAHNAITYYQINDSEMNFFAKLYYTKFLEFFVADNVGTPEVYCERIQASKPRDCINQIQRYYSADPTLSMLRAFYFYNVLAPYAITFFVSIQSRFDLLTNNALNVMPDQFTFCSELYPDQLPKLSAVVIQIDD